MNFSKQIYHANKFYNNLIKLYCKKELNYEQKINYLMFTASYAWNWHTGRFTSNYIENECLKIGSYFTTPIYHLKNNKNNIIVFLATELYETGGHTRLLENYGQYLISKDFVLHLIITRQKHDQVPYRIRDNLKVYNIHYLHEESFDKKISKIREVTSGATSIFNFQHPDDALIIAALNYNNRPYTYYVNHADQIFWLGISVADSVLNLRPFSQYLTQERRNAYVEKLVLPVRINLQRSFPEKSKARLSLGIDKDAIVFVNVSARWKIFPDVNYNIFEIINYILTLNDKTIVILVGVSEWDYFNFSGEHVPKRVKCYGVQSDTSKFLAAADYYLEGMPSNSLTALMEGIHSGAYPFLIWGPHHPNMRNDTDYYIQGKVVHPKTKDEYLKNLCSVGRQRPTDDLIAIVHEIKDNMRFYASDKFWDVILDSGEAKGFNRKYIAIDNEFQNLLYDQRLAEQSRSVFKMNGTNPYYSVISELFSKKLIRRYDALKLWFCYGLFYSGLNGITIKLSCSLLVQALPNPILSIKRVYNNLSDGNIAKKSYKQLKYILKSKL
jgi:hypothetical protein